MNVRYVQEGKGYSVIRFLSAIDRGLFLHHGWRWVAFSPNGQPESVHKSRKEAERYLFEAEVAN